MLYRQSSLPKGASMVNRCLLTTATLLTFAASSLHAQTGTQPDEGIQSRPPATVLLRGAHVVVDDSREIESADLLIRDGKIAEIGPSVSAPPEAEVIDLKGKTIYPAFIDTYVESSVPRSETPDAHWNSNIQAQRRAVDALPTDDKIGGPYRRAGFGAVLIAPNDGLMKGISSVVSTARRPVPKTVLRSEAFQHIQLVAARGERGSYPTSPMGCVALLRQTLSDAEWYQRALQAVRADTSLPTPDRNAALEALAKLIKGEQTAIIDGQNELYALRADRLAREFSLQSIIRGSGREYRQLDAIAASGRTFIIPVDFPKPPEVGTPEALAAVSQQSLMHWYLAPENPGRLEAAGVPFVFTANGLANPSDLLAGVRQAIERGLTEKTALAALTTRPARLLELDHVIGSVERGKSANFIVTDGPLFKKTTAIVETWVQGERYAWKDKAGTDGTGRWQMKLTGPEGLPTELELQWDEGDRPKGRIGLPGEIDKAPAKPVGGEGRGRRGPPGEEKDPAQTPDKPLEMKKPDSDVKPTDDSVPPKKDEEPKDKPPEQPTDKPADKPAEPAADKTDSKPAGEPTAAKPEDTKPADAKPAEAKPDAPAKSEAAVSELKQFTFVDFRVHAQFEPKKLKVEGSGVGLISAVGLTAADNTAKLDQIIGRIVWADGRISTFTASRAAKKEENKKGDAGKDDAGKDKAASDDDKKVADKKDADKKDDEKKPEGKGAEPKLCDVNYPLGAFGVDKLPQQPEWVIVRNATIWTCDDGGIIENGDLLVHQGVIADVGKGLDVPDGAMIIDGTGKHVSAGIIDCHSHMATDGGVNESGQAVTAEVRIGDFIDPNDMTIYRQLAGGVTAANILHGSANPIGGQNQVIKLRWGAGDEQLKMKEAPAGIKFALGENVKQSNFTPQDRGSVRYPQSRMGVEQIMRDRFEAAKLYREEWSPAAAQKKRLPPRRDLELEAIVEILEGKRWIHCHSYRQDEILTFLRNMESFGVTVGSLQHILEGYKVAEAIAKHGATASSFSDWWAYKIEVWDAIPHNGALMHQAGIVVSFNSDDDELARHLNHEAAKAMKYGKVPAEEAIKFVTLNPAKQLRIDKYVGSLAKGKHADFVIWNGSPLSVMSRVEQSWIDGRKYFDREQDMEARKAAEKLTRALVQKILDSGEKQSGNGIDRRDPSLWFDRFDAFCHHHHHEDEAEHAAKHDHASEEAQGE